ncbi:unnamed protein product [Cyclocybe aegerita]|uniref:Uncharacterized protein n=1 Tax=Cyclocybe aegerita TaxID=1973307 RepID=A0A8S0WKH6_CYCAE|nr:unnamed protein product [Cyclocybe aegerita]
MGSAHSSEDESDSGTAHPQEMEVEGTQGGEEVSRDPSVDLLLGQYALKFRDTVEDLPGDLEMTSFVNAVMATDFSRIRGPGELDNFSLASLLEAETSSKDEPTIHPAPIFRPPPPAARGPLDEGVVGVGAPPDVLMQALDDLVPPPPQKKSKVAYSLPGPPPPINRTTKPKPRPTTWAGIAQQAAPMPPPPPGLGPQRRGPSPPPPAFPTGPMKTSPHQSVPSFTSEGPTWKQVLVSFRGTPPDLSKFFTESAVRAANGYLRNGRSMLKVTSIICAYDGLSLVTPAVASPSDLDILRNFIRESLLTGTPFEVALPSSTSFIKILDVPYFDPKGLKITQEVLEKALCTSVHAEVFTYLSTKPRIDRNSAHSTSCTVYCNIWDSQQGTRAKKALGQPIFLAGQSCAIRPAARHTGVLLCQCCWKWGHPTVACKGNNSPALSVQVHTSRRSTVNMQDVARATRKRNPLCRPPLATSLAPIRAAVSIATRTTPPTRPRVSSGPIATTVSGSWPSIVRLSRYRPAMRRDIVNHRDILVLSLFSKAPTVL